MRRIRLSCLVLLFVVAAGLPYPPQARADTSDELLTYVLEAYDNLLSLDSFTASSDQLYQVSANLETYRVTLEFTYAAKITSEVVPQGTFRAHAAFDITMTNNMEPGATNVTTEIFIDGETVYARVGGGLPEGGQAGSVAPGWVNKDLLPEDASPTYNGINESALFQLFGMNYLFTPGAAASVRELDPQEVDGQMMRVIEVMYTSLNLEASGMMDNMIEAFNGQAMGFTEDMTREMLSGGSGYTFAVWIGENDHLPHMFSDFIEIESKMTYQGAATTISATMTTATNLTSVGEPITLTPPDVE